MAKKKYLFQVYLELVELSNVALRNEFIFVKVRKKSGGKFTYLSAKAAVNDHKVVWNENLSFQCKTQADSASGILDECFLRFSVRKEARQGGIQKLGFVDVNLSEFAGCGKQIGKYLLEGYSSYTRLDNSILKFLIDVQLISGDPLFKRTSDQEVANSNAHQQDSFQGPIDSGRQRHRLVDDNLRYSLTVTDATRVNNEIAVNQVLEESLRSTANSGGLTLFDFEQNKQIHQQQQQPHSQNHNRQEAVQANKQ